MKLELQLIGEIINEPKILDEVRQFINQGVFSEEPKSAALYKTILELDDDGKPIDTISVYEYLKKSQRTDIVSVTDISKLLRDTSSSANFLDHCKILMEQWMKRTLTKKMNNAQEKIKIGEDVFDIISTLGEDIYEIENNLVLEKDRDIYSELPSLINKVEQKYNGLVPEGLKSGNFPTLDKATGGIMSTDFVVVYGKEKSAKTTWAMRLLLDFAFQGIPVMIFTLEMDFDSSAYKALSMETGIEYLKLRNPRGQKTQPHELEDFVTYSKKFQNAKVFIDDKTFDFDRIIGKMKIMKRKYNIGVFMIDYLGLIESAKRFEQRRLEIKHYSRRLKNLTKELNTPIIAISQANDTEKTAESIDPLRDCDFALRCCKPSEDGIRSIKIGGGESYEFNEGDFLITVERSRHGKNKQNFVCGYAGTDFKELDLKHHETPEEVF